jgi:hypothetical protein
LPKRRNNALNATALANAGLFAALQSAPYTGVYSMRKKMHCAPPPLASELASYCLNPDTPDFWDFPDFSSFIFSTTGAYHEQT